MNTSLLIMERRPEQEINCCKCVPCRQIRGTFPERLSALLSRCGTCAYRRSLCFSHFNDLFLIKHLGSSNLLLYQVAWSGDAAQPQCCYGNHLWSKKFFLFIYFRLLGFCGLGFQAFSRWSRFITRPVRGVCSIFCAYYEEPKQKKGEGNAQINLKSLIPQTKAVER